jgi:hypothetical protein
MRQGPARLPGLFHTSRLPEATRMSKQPQIDHEYHAGKDKMKITIQGYSPSKKRATPSLKS